MSEIHSPSCDLDGGPTTPVPNIIDALPTEIIAHILCLCIPRFRPFSYSKFEAIEVLRLGRISRFLRALVYSTPELWATVTFFLRHTDDFTPLIEWLDRAKASPLRIRINTLNANRWDNYKDDQEEPLISLMNVIRPYLGRCVDLDLILPYPRSNILPKNSGALPVLEILTIYLIRSSFGDSIFKLNLTPDAVPRLREVGLFRIWVKELQIPWQALQVLHLDHVFTRECIFVLRHASNIVHFTLLEVLTNSSNNGYGSNSKLDSPIILPHLQTIDWLTGAEDILLPLFRLIVAPSLTILRIAPPDQGSFHSPCIFSLLQPCRDSLALVITMNLLDDEIFDVWSYCSQVTVVGLPMWKYVDKLERPPLNGDLISLYNTSKGREWPKVTHLLPGVDSVHGL